MIEMSEEFRVRNGTITTNNQWDLAMGKPEHF